MADETADQRIYEFEGFKLEAHRRLLLGKDGLPIHLPTKSFDTLVRFLEHPGEVIDRKTLLAAVWPKTVVEENNLSQAIAALRRALGAQCVLTVPRQGYQFTPRVRLVSEKIDSPRIVGSKHSSSTRRTMFQTAAGVVVIAALIVILVISAGPSDVAEPPTGEGSEPAFEAAPGTDRVQDDGNLPTDSYPAYVRFLAAQEASLSTSEGLETQISELSEAIRLDPGFALAYANLASAYAARARLAIELGEVDIEDNVALARQNAAHAIELDPSLGEAHALLAVASVMDGNVREVRDGLRTALNLSPNSPMVVHIAALYSLLSGHRDGARELFARFERFDRYGFD